MRRSLALFVAGSMVLACAQEAVEEADHGHTHEPGEGHQQEQEIHPAAVVAATSESVPQEVANHWRPITGPDR